MNDEIVQAPKEEYSYSKATASSTGLDAGVASKSDTYGKAKKAPYLGYMFHACLWAS